jgi:hypothetical protein
MVVGGLHPASWSHPRAGREGEAGTGRCVRGA